MRNETFQHIDPNEYHGRALTLHDCTADKISFENKKLDEYSTQAAAV